MLLAGTNDLSRRRTTPRKLLESTEVSDYNDLMSQHFAENESVIVIDTVPLEIDLFHEDGLHLSDT